jgi:hypothetical protein
MNGKLVVSVLVVGLCLAVVPASGGPLQKNEIHPAANWVAHADVEAFRSSGLGKLILAELQAQGLEEKLQVFAAVFSFNPLKDVRGVTLYGKGKDRNQAVVLIDGQFDAERLLAVVRSNAQYKEIPHQGVILHQWLNEEKKGDQTTSQILYGYIHGGRQIVISAGLEALKQAADTLKTPAGGAASPLLGQIPASGNGMFLLIVATGVGEVVGDEPQAAVFKQANLLTLTAGQTAENVSIDLNLQGASPEVADGMVQMFQGLVAAISLAGQEQPKLSELAKGVTVSRADKTAQVRFAAPAQAVFEFVKQQLEQKGQGQTPAGQ